MAHDLTRPDPDAVALTEDLVNIESVSGNEQAIADAVEAALRGLDHLEVKRFGHTVVARTDLGRDERVVIAGHIDTVPLNDNLPARRDGDALHGLGTCDMKGGVAVALRLAATMPVTEPRRHLPLLRVRGGRGRAQRAAARSPQSDPDLLQADFAILMEPSDAVVEAGCQGTLRVDVTHRGRARPLGPVLDAASTRSTAPRRCSARLNAYEPRRPVIDGLEYHEGLNAVFITGGVAGNVLPDECVVTVNYRFAPGPVGRARPTPTCARSSTASRSRSPTRRPARCPGCRCPPPRRSSRPSAARPTPSSAGPTWPGSAGSASRR